MIPIVDRSHFVDFANSVGDELWPPFGWVCYPIQCNRRVSPIVLSLDW